jgi:hypothetical protein
VSQPPTLWTGTIDCPDGRPLTHTHTLTLTHTHTHTHTHSHHTYGLDWTGLNPPPPLFRPLEKDLLRDERALFTLVTKARSPLPNMRKVLRTERRRVLADKLAGLRDLARKDDPWAEVALGGMFPALASQEAAKGAEK